MADRALPGIGLKGFWALGEDNWKDDMDANLLALSVLVQGRALSLVNATPGSPANGDIHLFGSTHPTQPNKLAVRDNGAWVYYTPLAGWRFYNIGAAGFYQFNGVTWTPDTAALTAEDVRDTIAAALVQGTNVTIVNDDPGDTITISAAGGSTDEQIQDMISAFLLQGSNVTLTYDDAGNHLTIAASGGGTSATNYGAWVLPVSNYVYDFEDSVIPAAFTQTNALAIVTDADSAGGTKSIAFAGGPLSANFSDWNFSFPVFCDATHSTVTLRMKIQSYNVPSGATEGVYLYVDGVSQGFVTQTADAETAYVDHTITGLAAGAHVIRVNYHTSAYADVGYENVYISKITAPLQASPFKVGDIVTNGGRTWECLVTGTTQTPTIAATDWFPVREKIRELLDYDDTTAPTDGQAVVFNAAAGKFKPGTVAGGGTSANQVSARYWRLRFLTLRTDNSTTQASGLGELTFKDSTGTTISTGGTAIASSSQGTNTPDKAFDGVAANAWYTVNGRNIGEWIGYDFGSAKAPTTFAVLADPGFVAGMPLNFAIDYSNDATEWFNHSAYSSAAWVANVAQTFVVPAMAVSSKGNAVGLHRYWGLLDLAGLHVAGQNVGAVQIQDIQFFSDAAATIGITQPTFTASNEYDTSGTYAAANLNVVGGAYWASNIPTAKWIKADFGTAVGVAAIKITPVAAAPNEAPAGFIVAYSDDGLNWTPVTEHSASGWVAGTLKTFTVPTLWPQGGSTGGLVKLAQAIVAVANNSIDFSGIPTGYEDLLIVINGQLSGSADFVVVRANGDATSGNYQYARGVFQTSGLSYSSAVATGFVIGLMGGAVAGASYADMVEATIQSYARTTFYKNARGRSTLRSAVASTGMTVEETIANWLSTAAINRLTFIPNSGNFTVGTVITIYGRG